MDFRCEQIVRAQIIVFATWVSLMLMTVSYTQMSILRPSEIYYMIENTAGKGQTRQTFKIVDKTPPKADTINYYSLW